MSSDRVNALAPVVQRGLNARGEDNIRTAFHVLNRMSPETDSTREQPAVWGFARAVTRDGGDA